MMANSRRGKVGTAVKILITAVVSIILQFGLAIWGWGGWDAFFRHPAFQALALLDRCRGSTYSGLQECDRGGRNENVVANTDQASFLQVVWSGGTPAVQRLLDSGCHYLRSRKAYRTLGSGFHETQYLWRERVVRCESPAKVTVSPPYQNPGLCSLV